MISLEWPRLFFLILKSADFFVIIMIFIFNIDCIELHHSTSCLSMGIGFFQDLPFCTCTNVQKMHVHICIQSEDFVHVQIMHVRICIRSEDFVHVQFVQK